LAEGPHEWLTKIEVVHGGHFAGRCGARYGAVEVQQGRGRRGGDEDRLQGPSALIRSGHFHMDTTHSASEIYATNLLLVWLSLFRLLGKLKRERVFSRRRLKARQTLFCSTCKFFLSFSRFARVFFKCFT